MMVHTNVKLVRQDDTLSIGMPHHASFVGQGAMPLGCVQSHVRVSVRQASIVRVLAPSQRMTVGNALRALSNSKMPCPFVVFVQPAALQTRRDRKHVSCAITTLTAIVQEQSTALRVMQVKWH